VKRNISTGVRLEFAQLHRCDAARLLDALPIGDQRGDVAAAVGYFFVGR
jgi:hypothetical protein